MEASGGTTMEALPRDVIANILSRSAWEETETSMMLPRGLREFRAMGRRRCVCKLWNSILTDSTLTQLSNPNTSPDLLLYSPGEEDREMLFVEDYRRPSIIPSYFSLPHTRQVDLSFLPPCPPNAFVRHTHIATSNGLVCLLRVFNIHQDSIDQDSTDQDFMGLPENPIYVLNPITDQHFELPPYTLSLSQNKDWFCGFGYDDSRREYKFVLVLITTHHAARAETEVLVLVHTVGSNSWSKKFVTIPAYLLRCDVVSRALVNGSFHWHCYNDDAASILSFNLGAQVFGFVQTPNSQHKELGVIEDHLAFVALTDNGGSPRCFDVWAMNTYNVTESWVRLFIIEGEALGCYNLPRLIKCCSFTNVLLFWVDGKLISYNHGSVRHLSNMGWVQAHPLVGSIISPSEASRTD